MGSISDHLVDSSVFVEEFGKNADSKASASSAKHPFFSGSSALSTDSRTAKDQKLGNDGNKGKDDKDGKDKPESKSCRSNWFSRSGSAKESTKESVKSKETGKEAGKETKPGPKGKDTNVFCGDGSGETGSKMGTRRSHGLFFWSFQFVRLVFTAIFVAFTFWAAYGVSLGENLPFWENVAGSDPIEWIQSVIGRIDSLFTVIGSVFP